MKKIFIVLLSLAAVFSCNRTPDPAVSLAPNGINIGFDGTGSGSITVNLTANRPWTLTTDGQSWYSVEPLSGDGDAVLTIKVEALEEVATRAAELTITAESASAKLSLVQGLPDVADVTSGSLVLEEVFFTGVLLEDGSSDASDGDQYIKITNNTDKLLYADGVAFCISSEHSQNGGASYWKVDDDLSKDILVRNIFCIPGDGDDVPLLPGRSLVIAFNAQDFKAENGQGLDLSKADFEIFDGEDVSDIDNPDVPNMELVVKSSKSISQLHGRSYESYALVRFPEDLTMEKFLEENAFTGTRSFIMNGETFIEGKAYPAGSYLISNAWVVDGINCGVAENLSGLAFNASIDAGYTGCGTVDKDETRFGKSALRKTQENGYLQDTKNSTNDFTRDAVPTLAE